MESFDIIYLLITVTIFVVLFYWTWSTGEYCYGKLDKTEKRDIFSPMLMVGLPFTSVAWAFASFLANEFVIPDLSVIFIPFISSGISLILSYHFKKFIKLSAMTFSLKFFFTVVALIEFFK